MASCSTLEVAMRLFLISTLVLLPACGFSPAGNDDIGVGRKTDDCPTGEVSSAALSDSAASATAELGVRIALADRTCQRAGVDCEPMEPSQGKLAEAFLASLRSELGRYPLAFLRQHGPLRIWLVDDLKMEGVKWEAGGVTTTDRTIYLNVKSGCTDVARSLVIQHEFFHVLDTQLFVNAAWNKAWTDLNPAGFRYGSDYNEVEGYDLHSQDGFATSYSTTNVFEDRAETYAFAVVEDTKAMLTGWMADDDYLEKKEASLKYWLGYAWPELDEFLADYAR